MDIKSIKRAAELIIRCKHLTAFTGAGISVESGIPPFRGENGLWSKFNPEVLDISFFYKYPEKSWKAIKEIFFTSIGRVKPNAAHYALAELEKMGILKAIITQNIDNLHQEAGSKVVYEFHGNAKYLVCLECGTRYSFKEEYFENLPPACEKCNGILKPDFIFFGEQIPQDAYIASIQQADLADVFLLIGTTGIVFPAAMIPNVAKSNGVKIIEINIEPSEYTYKITDIFIKAKATEGMSALLKNIKEMI